jgi:hypothetical protein
MFLENLFNKIHPFWSTDEIREGNLFLSSFLLPPPTHPLPLCPESQLLRVHRRQSSQGDLPSTTDRWDVQNIIAFAKSAGFRAKPFIATPTSEPRVYKGKRHSSPASASRAATESAATQSKTSAFFLALTSLIHIKDPNSNESKSPTSSSLTSPHPSTTPRSPLSRSRVPQGRVL